MKSQKIILIKLGGSVITHKDEEYTARPSVIRQLAKEIKKAKIPVVLSHGAGSFAHTSATKYGGKKGYKSLLGIAEVARDAMELNRIVMDILLEEKLPVVSLRPMSMMVTKEGKIKKNMFEIVRMTLDQGLIPVVYGDVIWDQTWKSTIFSGETTLSSIAIYLQKQGFAIQKVIQVGITDGVYDENGRTIPEITKESFLQMKKFFFTMKTADVTGGIQHKIEEALQVARLGIPTIVVNGIRKKELQNTLNNINSKFMTVIK